MNWLPLVPPIAAAFSAFISLVSVILLFRGQRREGQRRKEEHQRQVDDRRRLALEARLEQTVEILELLLKLPSEEGFPIPASRSRLRARLSTRTDLPLAVEYLRSGGGDGQHPLAVRQVEESIAEQIATLAPK